MNGQMIVGVQNIGRSAFTPYGQLLLAKLGLFALMLALVDPVLLPSERQVLARGDFKVVYQDFDWSLNEFGASITGRYLSGASEIPVPERRRPVDGP